MDIYDKYNLDKKDDLVVKELPENPEACFYEIAFDEVNKANELYINNNGTLTHISTKPFLLSYLLLFLKKYRDDKVPLPKEIIDNTRSNETMQKLMRFMLVPINTFEEFTQRLLLATKEIPSEYLKKYNYRYGDRFVFVNKREDFGAYINMYGEWIPVAKKYGDKYWERAILFDKENKIFELYGKEERTNDTTNRDNWSLDIKFYEEKYLYEYLLNKEIAAVY